MTARVPYPYSEALSRHWIDNIEPDEFVRVILLDDLLIGCIGYMPDDLGGAEIGYWLGKPWWGQGLGTEAAGALVRHCFGEARFSRLTCCHFTDNPASARVIRKLGFRHTGNGSAWCEARQADVEIVHYELNRPLLKSLFRRS